MNSKIVTNADIKFPNIKAFKSICKSSILAIRYKTIGSKEPHQEQKHSIPCTDTFGSQLATS